MTPERANELAAMCQASADWEPRLGEVASLLESHARMLEAAFPERIADAAGRHNTDGTLPFASAKLRCDDQLMWAHADRGALIAAVRALTAERDEARGRLAAVHRRPEAEGYREMMDALIPENLEAQLVIAAGKMPKLYRLNADKPDGTGGCPENGTIICPECCGTWAPELLAKAVTHAKRSACNLSSPELEHRQVPFRPENMRILLNIAPPPPVEPDHHNMWVPWMTWGARW